MALQSKERTVLITGLSGFTGKHLAENLTKAGWRVAGLGGVRLACEFDHLDADLNDTKRLSDWMKQVQPTHIIHLAALAHVTGSDALSYYRVNVLGTESLLNAIKEAEIVVEKIIIASSANIYGNAISSPVSESSEPQPVNHYALSKLTMEALVRKWFSRMPILVVRPFNYTGPGQSESFVFSKIVGAFARGEKELRLGNLDVSRDLSDVGFVVEAYTRLLTTNQRSEFINICSGRSISLLSVIDEMEQIAGYRPAVVVDPAFVREDEVKELYGSPAKLFDTVGKIDVPSLHDTLLSMYQQKAFV
ncbi:MULTISPECIES: GDP-mannose 4,6-dehydratase [Pseudomonas]|mgnify:CR=1 FL=1|uniref:Epimerase n=1 Tax=Pseudomonas fluorescens TaxID=294 RepID=A0A109LG31_PSEFL|nr:MULTISPECIES: GDP-mannose 4,6-dehydratase [Pseudomonas]KWV86839.1 GDP-6-deoxy-D-talose 4-dehydrogenase [Pseudomonas fluorescens]MBJ2206747.1 GDP-mannose 4,6-dehydratase [Pseudomonas carnis]MBV4509338.1 GDP-mannose 4,6-dehydratase [Pseudomonas sp. SWRI22]MCF5687123.1 NAD-dependent epimerase/dehydratase family protein [Pseudomonas sp. PA-1-3F]NMX78141.1 NAD-dependent epimerase/dehydratase family protein [Pseudomonas sp. WS 5503]